MSHQLRLVCVIAISFLTSVALAQGQSATFAKQGFSRNLTVGFGQSFGAVSAFSGQASSGNYTFASSPQQADTSQQQSNGNEGQSQGGNQNLGMSGSQNQNPNQNQNNKAQGKEEAPPPKPQYLTYTVKKKSLKEQAKSGKTLAVDFKSAPAGAVITVDGYFVGHTPTTAQIPLGKHLLSITKWGYQSWEQELDVAKGKSLSVKPTLHKDW